MAKEENIMLNDGYSIKHHIDKELLEPGKKIKFGDGEYTLADINNLLPATENKVKLFIEWDFWVVFTAGFTPIPYKVFTITSGAFEINLLMFTLASIISRGARFFLVAWLIWKYGPSIKQFIERYFNLLAFGFTFLLIGGFVLIKYII